MASPVLNFPRIRLTKQAKVLLAIAGLLLVTAPLLPMLVNRASAPEFKPIVETGLPCNSAYWPAGASPAVVTTDLGGGVTVSRPAMVLPGQPKPLYLCNQGTAR